MSVTFRAVIEEMTRPASTPMQEFAERALQARLALRDKLGLSKPPSQGEIAEALGWSQQKYSKMETGKQERLELDEVHALALQLRVDEYWLFTGRHPQPVGELALEIDRLNLDRWGRDAVRETARREAKRVAEQEVSRVEQERQDDELFNLIVEALMSELGWPRDKAERAARERLRRRSAPERRSSPPPDEGEGPVDELAQA